MTTTLFPASERGQADYGWLKTNYSFSFASWYDPHKMGFGALRVLNDDQIAPGQGFGMHSHQDMEIVTIVLKGELEHKDSMGNTGRVGSDEIQIMSAGTGVEHSEYNPSQSETLELFQLWIYPEKAGIAPRYGQKKIAPVKKNKWQQIVAPLGSDQSVLQINQNAYISLIENEEVGEGIYTMFDMKNSVYFMVIEGNLEVCNHKLGKRDAIGISELSEKIIILNTDTLSRILAVEIPM
jgi:quercetin 2,3-dioxygenase